MCLIVSIVVPLCVVSWLGYFESLLGTLVLQTKELHWHWHWMEAFGLYKAVLRLSGFSVLGSC